jgi:hypothetical protein
MEQSFFVEHIDREVFTGYGYAYTLISSGVDDEFRRSKRGVDQNIESLGTAWGPSLLV